MDYFLYNCIYRREEMVSLNYFLQYGAEMVSIGS